ncbi:MAG: hypothetical protein ACK4WD_08610 [Flavobacteriales bacterium]|jgi:hypothetical protein
MKLLFTVLALTLITSCTIEKRLYRRGFHIESRLFTNETSKISTDEVSVKESGISVNTLETSSHEESVNVLKETVESVIDSIACDTLLLKDGTKLMVKVESISDSEVRYKKCSNINGPVYIESSKKVDYIAYSNGSRDNIGSKLSSEDFDTAIAPASSSTSTSEEAAKKITGRKLEGFGLTGFISYLLAMLVVAGDVQLGGALGLIGLVLSIVSLLRFGSNRDRFKGLAFPIIVIALFVFGLLIAT